MQGCATSLRYRPRAAPEEVEREFRLQKPAVPPPTTTLPALIAYAGRRLSGRVVAQLAASLWRRPVASVPSRVLFAPETVAEADPAVAADIYAGVFALGGDVVDVSGGSPFLVAPPSRSWAEALHAFDWLHHLEANATELSSSNARALFDEWLQATMAAPGDFANDPSVAARRLVNWLVQSPLLLNGADPTFRLRYYRALGRHLRRLERLLGGLPRGMARLDVAAALALAGTVILNEQKLARWASAVLADTLHSDVLADGGHISRSPEAVIEALAALIPLREAIIRRQQPVPVVLRDAIERMVPMLRFFRHGDGGLAHFHGAGHVTPGAIDAVLAFDEVGGQPVANARYVGFQRLEAGASVAIVDTGRVPPPAYAGAAHASALAFEFSHGMTRIIVNCGALGRARTEWTAAARATAAQSGLVVADTSSARLLDRWPMAEALGPLMYGGPRTVEVRREPLAMSATHDGYRALFGLTHERGLALTEDGLWLEGEDRLIGRDRLDGLPFAIRFHIGPTVKVRLERSGRRALLALRDGSIWLFGVDHGPDLALEESITLVGPRRVRRTTQVVIAGNTLTDDTVRWHIGRHAAPLDAAAALDTAAAPEPGAEPGAAAQANIGGSDARPAPLPARDRRSIAPTRPPSDRTAR